MERDSLWAITAYFNPSGYRSRLVNYHVFRSRLPIPLLTVELSFDGTYELTAGDADRWMPVSGRDVMWQKERLLNLALQALPEHVDKVAWLDCDVVFADSNWVSNADRLLDRVAVIHLFDEVIELGRDDSRDFDVGRSIRPTFRGRSALAAWREGAVDAGAFGRNLRLEGLHSGLAWAARREALAPTGFYDACILGSGNRAMACAALNLCDEAVRYLRMNARQQQHFRSWAQRHATLVGGRVGVLDQTVYHLWHGNLTDRRYAARHDDLARHAFDPATDIALSPAGCWQWNSHKPDLHHLATRYFASRNEDAESTE